MAARDLTRAKKFYEVVFDMEMAKREMIGMSMVFFPSDDSTGKISGALVQSKMHKPGEEGTVVYLNGNPDLGVPLGRVGDAGGKVIMPKTFVSEEVGYMAFMIDTEGNKIGLHSFK